MEVTRGGPERIDCPRCGARIRLRPRARPASFGDLAESTDGFIRFRCPCGRRLKVRAAGRPEAGKCPDCGRVVPVPESAWSGAAAAGMRAAPGDDGARTEDMDIDDLARLGEWSARHMADSGGRHDQDSDTPPVLPALPGGGQGALSPSGHPQSLVKFEAGLRVCPRCGKPVHMSATTCRDCGVPVPRR
jgi:hypothetical protein